MLNILRTIRPGLPALLTFSVLLILGTSDGRTETYGIGFFEGGEYPAHSELRNSFRQQLKAMTPAGIEIVFRPDGFKSSDWDREKCRQMAGELTADTNIDLVVALGPWTVEDLLEAGFDRPIVAALRFDPVAEGLVGPSGRPLFENLTVRVRPRKLESDLRYLSSLMPLENLGFMYFPSGDETATVVGKLESLTTSLGIKLHTAEGYDNKGTFAFFKAYRDLAHKVEAVYLPPLWGFSPDKMRQFYSMLARDSVLAFSSEGQYHATRGAMASGSAETPLELGHYLAWKVLRIVQGTTPADLPVTRPEAPRLTINETTANQMGLSFASVVKPDVRVLEGPVPDDVERLTVLDAVSIALNQNPGLMAMEAKLLAAEKAVAESAAAYRPQLSLSGEAVRHGDNEQHNHQRYDRSRYRAGLRLEQELFSLQAIRKTRVASQSRDLVENRTLQAALDLELAVTAGFLDLFWAEQFRLMESAHTERARDCLRLARLRLDLREAPAEEIWRLEEEWLLAESSLRDARMRVDITRMVLNVLMGRPDDYPFVVDWQHFTDAKFFAEEELLQRLQLSTGSSDRLADLALSNLLAANPDLLEADLSLELNRAQLKEAGAQFYPNVGFFATLDWTDELAARPDWEEENSTWSLGASLHWSIFSGGRRANEKGRLRDEMNASEYRLDQAAGELSARVRTAVAEIYSHAERYPMLARAAELANNYYPVLQERYASGGGSLLELLDALENMRSASATAVRAQIDYFGAVAEFMRAAGISPNGENRSPGDQLLQLLSTATN